MNKQQQFYIFKFSSVRLKESNYNVKLTVEQARKNKELIAIGDDELLRKVRYNRDIDFIKLNSFKSQIKEIKRLPYSVENIHILIGLQEEIDKILFVPQVISITMSSKEQYENIYNNLTVNGRIFKRFICGNGQSRNSKVLFVEEKTLKRIRPQLENDIDKKIPMSANKFNAYFALYSSNTYRVRELKFCVVKDLEISFKKTVDYINYNKDTNKITVETKEDFPMTLKPHDGQGIITPTGALRWCIDLGIKDYIPSYFGVRDSYVKGNLVVCPINEYKTDNYIFEDAWGDKRDAREYDVFLSASQVKLWKHYKSLEDFVSKRKKNNLSFGVCRVAPKYDKNYCMTNYQYLQTLNMTNSDIKELCDYGFDWFNDILNGDAIKTSLYLLGNSAKNIRTFDDIDNVFVKALLLNNELINDTYIQTKIYNSIKNKIKKTFSGEILVPGNYQCMIADPYSMCQHIFGVQSEECTGLLKEGEHYSAYWNKLGVNKVDACRSPLTHYSEHNILSLVSSKDMENFYRFQTTGIIYPTFGVDTVIHADSDFDLDIVFSTSSPVFLRCVHKDMLPITYEKNKAPEVEITDDELFQADLRSFKNDIGTITNYSTDMYAMLEQFHTGSKSHNEILERLKITRMLQGNAIDKAKGCEVVNVPKEWLQYQKINYEDKITKKGKIILADNQKSKNEKKFLNKLVVNKKPYFQGYIYPKFRKTYLYYIEQADLYCKMKFGVSIDGLKNKKIKTDEENKFFRNHYRNMPLNIAPCVMNRLCNYCESKSLEVKNNMNSDDNNKIISILMCDSSEYDEKRFSKMKELYKYFCDRKKNHQKIKQTTQYKDSNNDDSFNDLQEFYKEIKEKAYEISSNSSELVNYAVKIVYELHSKAPKDFIWGVFGEDVLVNIESNRQDKIFFPIFDKDGDINYMGDMFNLLEVKYDI